MRPLESRLELVLTFLGCFVQGCAGFVAPPLAAEFAQTRALDPAIRHPPEVSPERRDRGSVHRVPERDALEAGVGLTYESAALAALAIHPELRAARAQRGIGRAQIVQAGILPNPQLSAWLDVPSDGRTVGTSVGYSAQISWALSPLIAIGAAVEAERHSLDAIELDIAWQEWQVAQGARLGVVRITHLKRRLAVARRAELLMRDQRRTLTEAVAVGDATALEQAASQSAWQSASLAVLQLVQAQRMARLEWLAALGLPPTSGAVLAEDPQLPEHGEPASLERQLARLPETRLDLAGLRRAYEAQDGRARAAALRAFPAVTVSLQRTADTSQLGTLGLGVTIALPFFDRNQGRIELATATRDRLRDVYLARVQRACSEVARAHANLRSVREQRALVERWVPTLERLVASSERLAGGGDVSVVDRYDLRLRLLDARLLAEGLSQMEQELWIALELASGVLEPVRSRAGR